MNIFNIENTDKLCKERNWNRMYWAIDLHDTIIKANYSGSTDDIKVSMSALTTLLHLSESPRHCLILFTSSFDKQVNEILEKFKRLNINFDYVNENPEVPDTELGNFTDKWYFNVLLDDKAGFEMDTDWELIWNELIRLKI